jgi:serine phosphatase RsbU (regulator of sigma subunit)
MTAWARSVAAIIGCSVRVGTADGQELLSIGSREDKPSRFPIVVNGLEVGWLELSPAPGTTLDISLAKNVTATLCSFAEVRNSMTDLVRTTARQWRELSILYRSSDLLRVDQEKNALATNLLRQASRALRSRLAAVGYVDDNGRPAQVSSGGDAECLAELVTWAAGLGQGVIGTRYDNISGLGFRGTPPPLPLLALPLRCHDRCHGSLILIGADDRVWSAEDLKLATLLGDQAGKAFANLTLVDELRESERMRREIELAAEIQSSIMPPALSEWPWLEASGSCSPAQWVGGDSYLVIDQGDSGVLAGVADVCGHGLAAALLMSAFASYVAALTTLHPHPAQLLSLANDLLVSRLGTTGMFVTAVLIRIDRGGGLEIAGAGHPEAFVVLRDGTINAFRSQGLPLGIMVNEPFPEVAFKLPRGASVIAYSDGVTETRGRDGSMYGQERLAALVQRIAPRASRADTIRRAILDDIASFRGSNDQGDDVTVIVLRRRE